MQLKVRQVSHETICQWVYRDKKNGGTAHNFLLRAFRGVRKQRKAHDGRGLLADRVSIHDRPFEANQRIAAGHWQGDTIHAQDGNFVTLRLASQERLLPFP